MLVIAFLKGHYAKCYRPTVRSPRRAVALLNTVCVCVGGNMRVSMCVCVTLGDNVCVGVKAGGTCLLPNQGASS